MMYIYYEFYSFFVRRIVRIVRTKESSTGDSQCAQTATQIIVATEDW